jgi:hypothetical protein
MPVTARAGERVPGLVITRRLPGTSARREWASSARIMRAAAALDFADLQRSPVRRRPSSWRVLDPPVRSGTPPGLRRRAFWDHDGDPAAPRMADSSAKHPAERLPDRRSWRASSGVRFAFAASSSGEASWESPHASAAVRRGRRRAVGASSRSSRPAPQHSLPGCWRSPLRSCRSGPDPQALPTADRPLHEGGGLRDRPGVRVPGRALSHDHLLALLGLRSGLPFQHRMGRLLLTCP